MRSRQGEDGSEKLQVEPISAGVSAAEGEIKEDTISGLPEEDAEAHEEEHEPDPEDLNLPLEDLREVFRKEKNKAASKRWRAKKEAKMKEARRLAREADQVLLASTQLPGADQGPPVDSTGTNAGSSAFQHGRDPELGRHIQADLKATGLHPAFTGQQHTIKQGSPGSWEGTLAAARSKNTRTTQQNQKNIPASERLYRLKDASTIGTTWAQGAPKVNSGYLSETSPQPNPQTLEERLATVNQQKQELLAQVQDLRNKLEMADRAAEDMLYEFQRLGKAQETDLKGLLVQIASFHFVSGGFQRNKEIILQLSLEVIDVINGGPTRPQDVAFKILNWNIDLPTSWSMTGVPTYTEVLHAFAQEVEDQIGVKLPGTLSGSKNVVSLRSASQMNDKVAKQWYIILVKMIQGHLPRILLGGSTADVLESKRTIAEIASTIVALIGAWAIGKASSFTAMRSVKPPVGGSTVNAVNSQISAFGSDIRVSLWHHWDRFMSAAPQLLLKKQQTELFFDDFLQHADQEAAHSQIALIDLVRELVDSYNNLFGVDYVMNLQCSLACISPLQLGTIFGLQLPVLPACDLLDMDVDPFLRWSLYFAAGTLPRA